MAVGGESQTVRPDLDPTLISENSEGFSDVWWV